MSLETKLSITGTKNVNHHPSVYTVRTLRLSSGETMPLVINRASGIPDTYVLRHAIVSLRSPGLSASAIKSNLTGVAVGLTFLDDRTIDLMARLGAGLFLSTDELSAFAQRCTTRLDTKGAVVRRFAQIRYDGFIKYLTWRFEAILHRASSKDRNMLKLDLSSFQLRAASQRPKGRVAAQEMERLGLLPAQRDLLLEVIDPNSNRNPFAKKGRVRNAAIVLIAYHLALRAGELAGLQRIDYQNKKPGTAMIAIHRRLNNPEDRRVEPARAKTKERVLPVSGELRSALDCWVEDRANRAVWPNAHRCHYLFTNGKGHEIELRGVRKIFERLRQVYPELRGLCQHVLRHDANDRFQEASDQFGWDPQEARSDQLYMNGWAINSKMPERYTRRSTQNRTSARLLKMQEKDQT